MIKTKGDTTSRAPASEENISAQAKIEQSAKTAAATIPTLAKQGERDFSEHQPLSDALVQATVTAVTFLLGFSLAFARFWSYGPGNWQTTDLITGTPLVLGIVILMIALFRSLTPKSLNMRAHRITVRMIIGGTSLVLLSMIADLFIEPTPEPETGTSNNGLQTLPSD